MGVTRHIGELVRALAVLALVFLNFAHAPLASPVVGEGWAAVGSSFCGTAPDTNEQAHAPCHACRIGSGADLPAAPVCGAVQRITDIVSFADADITFRAAARPIWRSARGPPAAA